MKWSLITRTWIAVFAMCSAEMAYNYRPELRRLTYPWKTLTSSISLHWIDTKLFTLQRQEIVRKTFDFMQCWHGRINRIRSLDGTVDQRGGNSGVLDFLCSTKEVALEFSGLLPTTILWRSGGACGWSSDFKRSKSTWIQLEKLFVYFRLGIICLAY